MRHSRHQPDLLDTEVQVEMDFTPRRVTVFGSSPAEYRALAKRLRQRDASQRCEDLAVDLDKLAAVIERELRDGTARIRFSACRRKKPRT